MKKIAVILNGCGHRDGSEVHEAVLTLLAIEEADAKWHCLAPDRNQASVLDHVNGNTLDSSRNMLQESARIARGRITALETAKFEEFDGVIIPGGFGTAKNLCTFAIDGEKMTVDPALAKFIAAMAESKKPIGAICIAPIILAKMFGPKGVTLTLGDDKNDAAKVARSWGANVVSCRSSDSITDEKLKIFTSPAYMHETGPADIAQGIRKLVRQMLSASI